MEEKKTQKQEKSIERNQQNDDKESGVIVFEYGNHISRLRGEREISREELCRGICDFNTLTEIENGKLVPESLLLDILWERLGVSSESFENYLEADDYNRWVARMQIINAIQYERWQEAEECLDSYQRAEYYDKASKLEAQFVLDMRGQIEQNRGVGQEKLQEIYRTAICLTMPNVDEEPIRGMALSLKELNLLLELERTGEGGGRPQRYLEIMEYSEKYFDMLGKAKLYPKAVYFLSQCSSGIADKELLQYCDVAVEYLREVSRTYYLWEILALREKLLERQIAKMKENPAGVGEVLCESLEQTRVWQQALKEVFDEFEVRKDTFEYCYLYVISHVYCMNDVIRVRRKMLGMSREVLSEESGISARTLQRIENKRTRAHRSTVARIFDKLNLPVGYPREELQTDDIQVRQKMKLLKQYVNTQRWGEAGSIWREIKKKISWDDVHNYQVILQKEAQIMRNMGEIDKQEYGERMKAALEVTMPLCRFLQPGEKHLTNQEQACLIGLMHALEGNDELIKEYADRMEEYYASYADRNLLQAVAGTYVFVMENVASMLGNCGEYEHANRIDEVMIKEYLRSRRLRILSLALYDRWWNCNEAEKRGISIGGNAIEQDLIRAIGLGNLDKQKQREEFYRRKWKMFYGED